MPPGTVGAPFPFCVSARFLEPASTSENLRCWNPTSAKVCRDRVGNYSDRHRLRHPAGSAQLTRGSRSRAGPANPTNSGLFRRVRDLLETTHCMQTAHEEHQFSATISELLPLATAARIYRSRGGWNVPTAAGSMTRDAALLLFSPRRRKHNLPDQLRVHPRSDRNGIA